MNKRDYARVREVFLRASEVPKHEQSALVASLCGDDLELRAEVDSLLAHQGTGTFPAAPVAGLIAEALAAVKPHPARIGHYRILRPLGQGGMGIVYLAEQDNPQRTVALKLLHPGIASPRDRRRFEHEAQLLGRLEHPGIARIYEAGYTTDPPEPQPFFAMELVNGVPITVYVEANRLSVRERLGLLANVCDAVHHAHQKRVVHCDLKPGNVLVDASGAVKVLDFGVARATDVDVQRTTMRTDVRQLAGTLAYMSPEQATGDPDQIDVRSDVHGLGVIGFELLTRTLPRDLGTSSVIEALRILREEPPRLLGTTNRGLRGDVETIIGKALAVDRERRYQSASALADDLRRYLRGEAIAARPPSRIYHLRKFAGRHRALVGGIAATFVTLAAGIVATRLSLAEARVAEQLAVRQSDLALRTSEFFKHTILRLDPRETGTEVRMADVLRRAGDEVAKTFADEPLLCAELQTAIGQTFLGLGRFEDAAAQLSPALATRRRLLGPDHRATRVTLTYAGLLAKARGALDEAALMLREAHSSSVRIFGAESWEALNDLHNLAGVLDRSGRAEDLDEAERCYRYLLEVRTRIGGEDSREVLAALNNLCSLERERGRPAAVVPLLRRQLEVRTRTQGEEHPERLVALNNLGAVLRDLGELEEAEPMLREALALQSRILGDDHPDTLGTMDNLAGLLANTGRHAAGEEMARAVIASRTRVLGPEHEGTLTARYTLALALLRSGQNAEACDVLRSVVAGRQRLLGDSHPGTLAAMAKLSSSLDGAGQREEALTILEEVLQRRRNAFGSRAPATLATINNLGIVYVAAGRVAEGLAALREAAVGYREIGARDEPALDNAFSLGFLELNQGQAVEAVASLRSATELGETVVGPSHGKTLVAQVMLLRALQVVGEVEQAAAVAAAIGSRLPAASFEGGPGLRYLNRLAPTLVQTGHPRLAEPLFGQLITLARTLPDVPSHGLRTWERQHADCLQHLRDFAAAERILLAQLASDGPADEKAVRSQLAGLYDAWQQLEAAEALRAGAAPSEAAARRR